MITSFETLDVSLSKVAMLVGMLVTSAVVINMSVAGTLSVDIFLIYSVSMLGTNSLNKYLSIYKDIRTGNYGSDTADTQENEDKDSKDPSLK